MTGPVHVSVLIGRYLDNLHGKQTDEKGKRRAEDVIEVAAGYDRLPNVQTIKRGRRA